MGLVVTLTEEPTILTKFEDLADVFLADEAQGLLVHGPQDFAIELQDKRQPPCGPFITFLRRN